MLYWLLLHWPSPEDVFPASHALAWWMHPKHSLRFPSGTQEFAWFLTIKHTIPLPCLHNTHLDWSHLWSSGILVESVYQKVPITCAAFLAVRDSGPSFSGVSSTCPQTGKARHRGEGFLQVSRLPFPFVQFQFSSACNFLRSHSEYIPVDSIKGPSSSGTCCCLTLLMASLLSCH